MTAASPVLERPTPPIVGPQTVVDLPVAVAAIRGLTARIVADRAGGPVIDSGHPLGPPLVPHAGNLDSWVSLADPADLLRLRTGPALTLVFWPGVPGDAAAPGGADVVVVDRVAGPDERMLLHLDPDRRRVPPVGSRLLGFAIELPPAGDRLDRAVDALRAGWSWWRSNRAGDRPVILLRSGSCRAASRAARAWCRWAAAAGQPSPTIRVDLTALCTRIAATTTATVLACTVRAGITDVVVDHLPPTLDDIRVVGGRSNPTRVLLRDRHRMAAVTVHGGPPVAGDRLAAAGWSGRPGPLHVRDFPDLAAFTGLTSTRP